MGSANSILSPTSFNGGLVPPPGYVTPTFPGLYTPSFDNDGVNVTGSDGMYLYFAEDVWHFTLYWFIIIHALIFIFPAAWFTLVSLFSRTSSLTVRRSPVRRFFQKKKVGKGDVVQGNNSDEKERLKRNGNRIRKISTSDSGGRNTTTFPITDLEQQRFNQTLSSSSSSPPPPPPGFDPTTSTFHRSTSRLRRSFSISTMNQQLHHHQSTTTTTTTTTPKASAPIYLAFLPFLSLLVWSQISALVLGTIIGFTLSAVFTTANFYMSTWVPLLWAIVEGCIVIISTYSTVTSIL